ncbi:flagellar basal body M-ring protein FliF [Plesiomonas shigelloides]|uniref:flagellar basal-body MS-ring/collar protein FliF n=1 Tax=Plesiomonas shigelloides TaxID=703 RepID=UPI0012617E84|nr:flagellar basal-body MS-ring/collar protein FliF [Plesiomonas shigelloides]KAB7701660.1 flagellar basal body M-ring protein FliF [Plesiomonas shigelloides]
MADSSTTLATATDPVGAGSAGQNPDLGERSSRFEFLSQVDWLRQLILVVAVAICIALIIFAFFWAQEPEMRPLGTYGNEELVQTLDYLDQNKVPYKLDGNTIKVAQDQYQKVQLMLTRAGLDKPADNGDSILLSDMGFGVSQRLERERLKLSRERQLASAIEQIRNVMKAQVLLALPRESVFIRDQNNASASVMVTLRAGKSLTQEEVDSIVDMVASAVPGLSTTRVTVSDQTGRLLNSGSQDPASMAQRREFDLQRQQEKALREKIDSILIPVLGMGAYTAEVGVLMDFTQREQTQKQFDQDKPAMRSEFSRENVNRGRGVAGVPGALSNQPPADSSIPQDVKALQNGDKLSDGSFSKESTRNYEVDTTIKHTRQATGQLEKMSVSVAVDYKPGMAPDTGNAVRVARNDAELENLRRLLIGGLGMDMKRGDVLELVSVPFASTDALADITEPAFWESENFRQSIRYLSAALVVVVLLLVLVRPAMQRLLNPKIDKQLQEDAENELLQEDELKLLSSDLEDSTLSIGSMLELPNLHRDEDLVKAVRALAANEPELATQVIKYWLENHDK